MQYVECSVLSYRWGRERKRGGTYPYSILTQFTLLVSGGLGERGRKKRRIKEEGEL